MVRDRVRVRVTGNQPRLVAPRPAAIGCEGAQQAHPRDELEGGVRLACGVAAEEGAAQPSLSQ